MSQLPTASEVFAMWDPCSGNGGSDSSVSTEGEEKGSSAARDIEDNSGGQRREGMTRAERRMQKEKASKETEPRI